MPKKRKKRKRSSKASQKKRSVNWRIKALFLVFILMSGAIIARLYFLQIVHGDYYAALARGQKTADERVIPRGKIYFADNAGEDRFIAATNKEAPLVYANPKEIKDERAVLSEVKKVIEIPEEDTDIILDRMRNKNLSYALIARGLSKEKGEEIDALKLPGVYTRTELARIYPAGSIASDLLGFLGFSGSKRSGQYGLEEFYDPALSGDTDSGFFFTDLFSPNIDESADLELSVDYGVQFAVEKKLETLVEELEAESASAIFMDPSTGAIIAMAIVPDFNPNNYNAVENISIFSNETTQAVYELGSVFKPITMAAAIDAGVITPKTVYEDTGKIEISGYTIRNSDGKAYENQTMTEALEKSLNTGAIFAQQEVGKKKFREYLENFQLDKVTGVDLPGEVPGNIENVKNTNRDINFATASFGQGISFSPLRFLASMAAIANEGKIMRPYVVDKINYSDKSISTDPEVMAQPINSLTASRITAMMVSVVENGYGEKAKVPGYTVAGKTGTAQVPNPDGPGYSDKTIHSFVGFAPAYNPKFIGIVKVDNPQNIKFSADSVTPAFGDLASFILQYYKIPPQ
ncbi:MAG: penicillin-binding protein 2 [Candidatus Spechtbacterales bacterium]|nr:penicillin-binding protein 2 [Candidatus Spechtbacterales bacterium]